MACIFVSRILDVDHKQDLRPLSFLKNSVVSLMTLQNDFLAERPQKLVGGQNPYTGCLTTLDTRKYG